jgi:hypothetical protein
MKVKRIVAVAACTIAVAGLGAGSAFAGEITGNAKWIRGTEEAPLNGKSECAYSGQNDEFVLEVPGDHGRTQSFGQIVRFVGSLRGGWALTIASGPSPQRHARRGGNLELDRRRARGRDQAPRP